MPSPHSLRRLANLTKKVHDDLRRGGMGMTFKYLFRSTAILARVTAILADHVATQAGAPPADGEEPLLDEDDPLEPGRLEARARAEARSRKTSATAEPRAKD